MRESTADQQLDTLADPRHTAPMTQPDRDPMQPESFTRGLGKEIRREARHWLRWTTVGAAVGAAVVGGAGLWYFGLTGLWIGAAIGAVVGGGGAMMVCGDASIGF